MVLTAHGHGPSSPPRSFALPRASAGRGGGVWSLGPSLYCRRARRRSARSEVKKHASVSQSCVCCCSTLHSPTPFFLSVSGCGGAPQCRSNQCSRRSQTALGKISNSPSKVGWGMAVNYTLTEGAMGVNPSETHHTLPRKSPNPVANAHVPHHAVECSRGSRV